MRTLLILFTLLVAPSCASASEVKATILEYGLYAIGTTGTRRPSASDPTGYQSTYDTAVHTEQTDSVCARLGTAFGFRFAVAAAGRRGAISVTTIVRYPPPGITNTRKVHFAKAEYQDEIVFGAPSAFFYVFDEPWEMVAGVWTFEVHADGRKLVERAFTVATSCGIS